MYRNQTNGRVFLFLETDNFQRDYDKMLEKGINFFRKPDGTVAVFEGL